PFPLSPELPLFARCAFDASCTETGTAPVEPASGLFRAGFGCGTAAFESWSLEPEEELSCFFACPGGEAGGVGVVATGAGSVTVAGGGATGTTAEEPPPSCFFTWPGA